MEQDKIWDYLQNEGAHYGQLPAARQHFISRKIKKGQVVLDVGVGGGDLEKILSQRGIEIYSLDPSKKTIDRLRFELGMGDKAQVGYGQEMPFPDQLFDVVVLAEVLEHLDDEVISAVLSEVFRVLKPGGTALITTPYNERLSDSVTVCPDCGKVYHRVGHVQSFTIERITDIVRNRSFEITKAYTSTFIDWSRPGVRNRIKSILRYILARLGEQVADPHIILFARRPTQNDARKIYA